MHQKSLKRDIHMKTLHRHRNMMAFSHTHSRTTGLALQFFSTSQTSFSGHTNGNPKCPYTLYILDFIMFTPARDFLLETPWTLTCIIRILKIKSVSLPVHMWNYVMKWPRDHVLTSDLNAGTWGLWHGLWQM
jgi:hypothetical protein